VIFSNVIAGQGAYGFVIAVRDRLLKLKGEDDTFAIKKIERAFEHRIFTKRTLRELKIMRLCNHENVKALRELSVNFTLDNKCNDDLVAKIKAKV